jgi:hypothetical protein
LGTSVSLFVPLRTPISETVKKAGLFRNKGGMSSRLAQTSWPP